MEKGISMNNNRFWGSLSFGANIVLAALAGYLYFANYTHYSILERLPFTKIVNVSSKSPGRSGRRPVRKYKVAVVMPAVHPALEEIEHGFEKILIEKYNLPIDLVHFNANGSKPLLRAQLEEVAQCDFDLLFTIGAGASQLAKELFEKRQVDMPIVFGAVADPVRLNLIKSIERPGTQLTGSAASADYQRQAQLFTMLKPTTKSIALFYDPGQSSGLSIDCQQVVQQFATHGVVVKPVEVFSLGDLQKKAPLVFMDKSFDTAMILKDNTVVPGVDLLVKLCERYNITLFCSDIGSVQKGAACGFGVKESDFGKEAAECAYQILCRDKRPHNVPVRLTENFKLAINPGRFDKQDIYPEGMVKLFLSSIKVVESS
jgi:putative ABC transport system substrate-binding protein